MSEKRKWGMKLQPRITLQPAIGKIMRENLLLICALARFPLEVSPVRCMCQMLKMWKKVCVSGVWLECGFHKARGSQLIRGWSWRRSFNASCQATADRDIKTGRNRKGSFLMNYWECHIMNPVSCLCRVPRDTRIADCSNFKWMYCILH